MDYLMASIFVFIKQLPKPVSYCGTIYLSCLLGYNGVASYMSAKRHLEMFRGDELKTLKPPINTEWEAVKYGAYVNSGERLWNSIVWPVKLIENLVPWLVLTLNPKKD